MVHITRQIDVAATPEAVFAVLTDLDRLPEWATIVADTRDVSDDRPLQTGCTFRHTIRVMGQELDTDWQVTELGSGRLLAYEASSALGGRLGMTQTIMPRAGGSTVRLEVDYDLPGGFLGDLLDVAVLEAQNEREAERSLQNLKALLNG
ncbi:MAG: SRPBCC family protein [Myxococcales bacterium]|nr:SRPBCC family protein [Myxococcales bacterium]